MTTTTAERLVEHQADFKASYKATRDPRLGNPVPAEPVVAHAEPAIITDLRNACEAGEVGTLTAHRGQLASMIDAFAGTGLSQRVGYLDRACVITIARELSDVLATVTSSGMFLRGAERFRPEFGRGAVTEPDLLKHIESMIDRNRDAALPALILLDESVCFEDNDALRELAQRRRVCIARAIETDDTAGVEWRADGD